MAYAGYPYGSAPLGGTAGIGGVAVANQDLTLTLHAPVVNISVIPSVLTLALTLELSNVSKNPVPTFDMNLTIHAPNPVVITAAASLPLALTIHAPFIIHDNRVYVKTFGLGIQASLYVPEIIRYIKDPVRSGGCPQCGTFLYPEYGAETIHSEAVFTGRSFDVEGEDKFIRCSRCNWLVKPKRTPSHRKGSYTGWGLTYEEVRATPVQS